MRGVKRSTQLDLAFRSRHGGARPGAGRKRLPAHLRHTPHRSRAPHRESYPVHVTLRSRFASLRRQVLLRTVLTALRVSNRAWFRIAHYSIQANHIHLIVEAESHAALASGMRGLAIRLARRANRMLRRHGQFWADRWYDSPLRTPRQVRHALVYVLQNRQKHAPSTVRVPQLDPLSSAQWFDGFARGIPRGFRSVGPPCVVRAHSWLLRIGWKKRGLIEPNELPQGVATRRT